jgi:hypothetical protein
MTQNGLVRRSRVLAALGALVLLFGGLMVVASPPAYADDTCVLHPSDPDAIGSGADNSVVCLKDNHTRLDVCDRHSDGHRVYVRRIKRDGTVMPPFYDEDGAGGFCGHYYHANWATVLSSYNVCVETEGCGAPKYWWEF